MSVVNKMLKDLEARENTEQQQARYEAPPKKSVSLLTMLVLLVIIIIALALWAMFGRAPTPPQSVPTPLVNALDEAPIASSQKPLPEPNLNETSHQAPKPIDTQSKESEPDVLEETSKPEHTEVPNNLKEATKVSMTPTHTKQPSVNQPESSFSKQPESSFSKQNEPKQTKPAIEEQVRLALEVGDYNTAIELMQQRVQSSPSDIAAQKKLASLLFASGQVDQAQTLLQKMLVNRPTDHSVRLMLSRLYVKQGLTKHAIDNANAAIPSPDSPLSTELLSFRANLLQQNGNFTLSLNDYFELTKRMPTEPKWWLGTAVSADNLNQTALALNAYSQFIQNDPQRTLSADVHQYVTERIARLRDIVYE